MSKTLLIDADILVYQTACRNEENYDWGDDIKSQIIHLEDAKGQIDEQIGKLLEATKCQDFLLCFTSNPNFRHAVLSTYKANRKNKPKPVLYRDLYDYCANNFQCKTKPNLEADDVLGVLATRHPGRYVVASCDKDLLQIPGTHYNWLHEKLTEVTEGQGDYCFFTQVLTGDPTDNYTGCPGIGPAKAQKILQRAIDEGTPWANQRELRDLYWKNIVETYVSKGLTEADALVQARVARILRAADYDFKRKQPILWKP